jgi:NAD-dependent SIR2 family protein deacetylase
VTDDPIPPSRPRFRRAGAGDEPDDDHTDGNELAGVLDEVFAADVSAMPCRCASCGMVSPLATYRVHHGAGLVARCPGCDATMLRVGVFEERLTLMWGGTISLARPA